MNIIDDIKTKWDRRLYKKVGKKFVPCTDPWATDGLREGWWLVGVKANSTSIRHAVYPARAELQAAAQEMEDNLIDIIRKATEGRPSKTWLTPAEKKDWDAMMKKHGTSFNTISYPSFAANAQSIVDALLNKS